MNAMIFAAGLGTRLRPLTNDRPKAMVEVAGKPLLQHQIEKLKQAGFDHIVINIHHFGQQIIDFLSQNDNFGLDIRISDERDLLLDTGGGIRKALSLFDNDDPILIHNVDIISDIDVKSLYESHKGIATLAINQRKTSRYLIFNQKMQMQGWTNIQTGEVKPSSLLDYESNGLLRFAFSGIHIVDKKIAKYLNKREEDVFPIMDFYISLCQQEQINGIDMTGHKWVDCGNPEHLDYAKDIICSLQ